MDTDKRDVFVLEATDEFSPKLKFVSNTDEQSSKSETWNTPVYLN